MRRFGCGIIQEMQLNGTVRAFLFVVMLGFCPGAMTSVCAQTRAGDQNAEPSRSTGSDSRDEQAEIHIGAPVFSRDGVLRMPLLFAPASKDAGKIHLQIKFPEKEWKFVKIETARDSRFKTSSKQQSPGVFDVVIDGRKHVIIGGPLGTLQFKSLRPHNGSRATGEGIKVKILETAPPETETVTGPPQQPFELPSEPPPNPSVACFFFSH
jgi:hypothetical protein